MPTGNVFIFWKIAAEGQTAGFQLAPSQAGQIMMKDVVSGARRQAASARMNVALMMSATNGGLHHPLMEVHC